MSITPHSSSESYVSILSVESSGSLNSELLSIVNVQGTEVNLGQYKRND